MLFPVAPPKNSVYLQKQDQKGVIKFFCALFCAYPYARGNRTQAIAKKSSHIPHTNSARKFLLLPPPPSSFSLDLFLLPLANCGCGAGADINIHTFSFFLFFGKRSDVESQKGKSEKQARHTSLAFLLIPTLLMLSHWASKERLKKRFCQKKSLLSRFEKAKFQQRCYFKAEMLAGKPTV